MDGFILYENGDEMNCSVTLEGISQNYIFDNEIYHDLFDGTIYANSALIGIRLNRVVFKGTAGHTGYVHTSSDANGNTSLLRKGDELLSNSCDTLIISCCYDYATNTDTADEAYRCLIIAPATNAQEAANIIESFKSTGYLEQFDTWDFTRM